MNKQVTLDGQLVVCGMVHEHPHHLCIRPPGHWGPHVVKNLQGEYFLQQTQFCQIIFPISPIVAEVARQDKDWTWPD